MIVRIMDLVSDWWGSARTRRGGRHWSLDRPRWWLWLRRALTRGASGLALHGRPLALRLVVLLLPTTVAATTLGVLKIMEPPAGGGSLAQGQRFAAVSRAALLAITNLENERDLAARATGTDRSDLGLEQAHAESDAQLAGLDAAVDEVDDASIRFTREDLRARLDGLSELRRAAFASLAATSTVTRYGNLILDVIRIGRIADSRATQLAGAAGYDSRGIYDLVLAAGLNSQRRAIGTALLERGRPAEGERGTLGGFGLLVELQTGAFRSVATPATLTLFQTAGVEAAAGEVNLLAQRITSSGDDPAVAAATWIEATTRYLNRVRQVIMTIADRGAATIAAQRVAHTDDLRLGLALIVAVLLVTVLLAAAVGYGLAADLRRLRDRMRKLASRGPAGDPGRDVLARNRDEIGKVARVFEGVHAEAMRVAATQTAKREVLAGAARTLARRTQDLVVRQLELITELEQRHTEPETLERLFSLDHLATRVRRHGGNLLVLAGGESAWRWPRPARLVDVVKAAAAATEQYQRLQVQPLPVVDVVAPAVVDLIQILTELIDNAARFSSPDRPVRITGGWLADGGLRIEVRDEGQGFGSRTAAALNARLSGRGAEPAGDEPTLGLFIVSMLAARTGIGVHLVAIDHGCVATISVPAGLLAGAAPAADAAVPEAEAGAKPRG